MRQVSFRCAARNFLRLVHEVETTTQPVAVIVAGRAVLEIRPAPALTLSEKRALAKSKRSRPGTRDT